MAKIGKTSSSAPARSAASSGFKGNKASLPSKPCVACGRPISWRRAWARSWAEVKHCSDACRASRGGRADKASATPRRG